MRVILLILLLIFLTSVIWFQSDNEGQMIIEWFGFHLEFSAILIINMLAVSLALIFLLTYFLIFLKNIPSSLRKYYGEKQHRQDLLLLLDGFGALYNGDLAALKQLLKNIRHNQDHEQMQQLKPLVALLIAAYNEAQCDFAAEEELEDAYQLLLQYEKNKLTALRGLIRIRMKKKRYHDALNYAEKA